MNPELHIRPDTEVGHVYLVSGKADGPVQVFIKANDDVWYLQKEVQAQPNKRFTCECDFGFWDVDQESKYEIIAVATESRPSSPMKELPIGEKSDVIRVWRVR